MSNQQVATANGEYMESKNAILDTGTVPGRDLVEANGGLSVNANGTAADSETVFSPSTESTVHSLRCSLSTPIILGFPL